MKAGLWETNVRLLPFGEIDFAAVQRLAEEQSVVGLVAAGLGLVSDIKVEKKHVIQFIGQTFHLEQRNQAMNRFIGGLVDEMRKDSIYALLIKGQGIAQCYERPLWRASGDVDFYLSKVNFEKAKLFFKPKVESFDPDNDTAQHINMHYDQWVVEIHGDQHGSLSPRINKVQDEIQKSLFYDGNVRSSIIGDTTVFLPSPDNDVLIVFTHFVNHFYKGGLGVRQICDWCRLLWTYKGSFNLALLEDRLQRMGLASVWMAFAAFAVDYLGMPKEVMPLYSEQGCWKRKARRICSFIMKVGNFGRNRDSSYYGKYPKLICKLISMCRRFSDTIRHARIFPIESLRFLPCEVYYGIKATIRGE